MKKYFLFLFICLSLYSFAQNDKILTPGNVNDFKKTEHGVLVRTENASAEIMVYSPAVIRVRVSNKGFEQDFSYAVIQVPAGNFKEIKEAGDSIILATDSLKLIIRKKPFSLVFYDLQGKSISEDYHANPITWLGTEVTGYKKLFQGERFIGLGEKTGPLDRRGNAYVNWNTDIPAYPLYQDPLYVTIPFYIGIHDQLVYGIFLDNTYRTKFNFGASTDDLFSFFSASNGELNYYFFGARSIPGLIRDYTWLTGRIKLPPYWSLGYQQCRWSYYPESEVMTLAQNFRNKKIPCDVIYLDIDYMDHYKIFTWNNERFPDPKAMIGKLNGMGFHVVTIVDPGIKIEKGYKEYEEGVQNGYFARYPDGSFYTGSVWPGRCHFPDFTNPKARDWWGSSFSALVEPGVEGFWNDMNEPSAWGQSIPDIVQFNFEGKGASNSKIHNVYGFEMSRATFEGTKKLLAGKRPFVLSRAGYSGIPRYSTVWTGDNVASDDHMLLGVRLVNSLGVSGLPFTGPDLGGFIGSPSKELFVRWLSIGVYTPFFRNHSEINSRRKEPWSFGEETERLSREWINQRYRLLPYIYSALYGSAQTGMPVQRTLAILYPDDKKIYEDKYQNEYLFGDALLVAPVPSDEMYCKVYLPQGEWYRLSTDEKYQGNTESVVPAPLDDLPVFVKAGGIIPLQSVIQYTGEKPSSVLELNVYNGADGSTFIYYEDDGQTFDYEKGIYYKRVISFDPSGKRILLEKAEGTASSRFTDVRLLLHSFGEIMTVNVNGRGQTLKPRTLRVRACEIPLTADKIEITY